MERYDNNLKVVIPRPELEVSVSNPFALVGEEVTLLTQSKWVTSHHYVLDGGNGVISDENVPSVVGKSSRSVHVGEEKTLEQSISIINPSGNKTSLKRIYAMQAQTMPYFDVTVSKEIIRTDNETTQIRIHPEHGYSRNHTAIIRVFKENESESPVSIFTDTQQGDGYEYAVFSNAVRGIYDVEVDMTDTATGKTLTKRINKLITITPKLAPRVNAYEFVIPNAKTATNVNSWLLDGNNYPKGSTIVLKADPNEPQGYAKRLKFVNFKGTWDNPYIITIDQDIPLTIDWYYYFGINIGGASEHMVFDGRGYQNIENGIKLQVYPGESSTAALSAGELSHELELFEIEIEGTGFAGFFIKTDPDINKPETWYGNFNFNRLLLHHNYIHDTDSEGCYLGHYATGTKTGNNNQGQAVSYRAHHLYNCRVYRNEYINNGYDALQFNNAEDLEICYNRFINSGYRNESDQSSCMSLSLSGRIYNNTCLGYSGPAIQFGALGKLEIFNNIFANGSQTAGGLYLLASEDTPEQNPNNQMWNEIPVLIYNNTILSKSGMGLGARNTTQFRNIEIVDNFVVTYNGILCGGQKTETVELWKAAAKGNVIITQKVDDYPALDDTYGFGDSAGGDYRIAAGSRLITDANGKYFKFDFRGYKNWFASVYPVGPFMGICQLAGMDETFRILTLTLDNGASQTVSGLVTVSWTFYGNIPVTAYLISENPDFAGAEWTDYVPESSVTYQFIGNKGPRMLYAKLRNADNVVTESKSVGIQWAFRTALLAIMSSDVPAGKFNADTGIHYHRLDYGKNVQFKDTLGNLMGVINADTIRSSYAGNGINTGDNSGIYPDKVLELAAHVKFDASAKTLEDPLVITMRDLAAGTYRLSVFANSNRQFDVKNQGYLDAATPYFKFKANEAEASAILLWKNFNTLVEVGKVTVGSDGLITLTAYWEPSVLTSVIGKFFIYGSVNLIKLEEI